MKTSLPVVLTPTRVEAATACERKHVLQDVLEKGKEKNVAAAFGNVLHDGHAEWWRKLEFDKTDSATALEAALVGLETGWNRERLEGRDERYTLGKAETMFRAYSQQARRVGPHTDTDTWRVFTIEDRIRVPARGYKLSMQIDRSFVSATRRAIRVGDLKTVTRPDNKWRTKWYSSLQMKLYYWGAKEHLDFDDVEFWIEGLDKNAAPRVHEVMLPQWSDALLEEALDQFERKAERDEYFIRRALDSEGNVDILRLEEIATTETDFNYENCHAYGGTCPFLDLCLAEPDQRAAILRAEYDDFEADY